MAILQRYTAAEALNTTTAGIWTVKTVITVVASSTGTSNSTLLSEGAHSIIIQPTADIYISFSTAAQNISTTNDLRIAGAADEFLSITLPRGLGNTIYFNTHAVLDETTPCRLIEV